MYIHPLAFTNLCQARSVFRYNLWSLQNTLLQILLFYQEQITFYSFLPSLILRRVRTEIHLLESTS